MGSVHQLIRQQGIGAARQASIGAPAISRQCVEAAYEVMADEQGRMGILHTGFAMTALPHKKVDDVVWQREGGGVTLQIQSGLTTDQRLVGIPFGSLARLILIYLQSEAVKTRSRDVEMGGSMNAWLGAMGITAGGKTYQLVREQANRISRCRLTFFRKTAGAQMVSNGAFVRDAILPLDSTTGQLSLWQERVRLDEGFYQQLMDHPLPIRETAIKAIAGRSMAIDLYVWLAYRLHVLERPTSITWLALKEQFGQTYKELRFFRRDIIPSLELAMAAYPEARVDIDEVGVTLHPSAPPIRKIASGA